jgi:hypothetical protein
MVSNLMLTKLRCELNLFIKSMATKRNIITFNFDPLLHQLDSLDSQFSSLDRKMMSLRADKDSVE